MDDRSEASSQLPYVSRESPPIVTVAGWTLSPLLISTWTALDGKMIEKQLPSIIPLTVVLSR
jgi:hypothetical protein